jgi:hypothetical protein
MEGKNGLASVASGTKRTRKKDESAITETWEMSSWTVVQPHQMRNGWLNDTDCSCHEQRWRRGRKTNTGLAPPLMGKHVTSHHRSLHHNHDHVVATNAVI